MSVAAAAARHSRAALLVTVALVVAGAIAAFTLPSGIYPPLQFPRIVIIARSGTLPPQSMTLTVTRPIETAVMEVPGIRRVRSRSIRGAAEISAQFDPAADMIVALQQVQNRLAEARGELPTDLDLTVERLTPAVFPILILSMTGSLPTPDLNDFATYVVKPELARVPGAGRIEVLASDSREIEVVLDPTRLSAAGLSVVDVADALKAQNQLLPVGRFPQSGQQHLSLASGLWQSSEQIADAPVVVKNGATIRVSDIGRVTPGSPDRTLLITGNGRDAISISISQQIEANILAVKQGVDAALATLATTLPSGIRLTKVYDLAEFVSAAIANVRDAILIGSVLAVVVLILFLRDVRLTLIAAATLPLAVIPTFVFLRLFHGSINLMSMGGLAVAIGLVIDDAVVVVENIHRRASEGDETVTDAVQQLMAPLVSSTLTTVVVFMPLGLLSGVIGQFFRALSTSLAVAVLLSLALSITVVPMMARRAFRRHHIKQQSAVAETRLTQTYGRALTTIVRRPLAAILLAVILAVAAVVGFYSVGTGFLPKADEGGFVIDYLTPAGSSLEETDRHVRAIPDIRRLGSPGTHAIAQRGDIRQLLRIFGVRHHHGHHLTIARPKVAHHAGHAGREPVVVAIADLAGGHGVVLVDHGHGAVREQCGDGLARVEVAPALLGVAEREQDLRRGEPVRAQHALVGTGERDLAHRRRGLRLLQLQRPARKAQHVPPQRDGARGYQDHLLPRTGEAGHVLRQRGEPVGVEPALPAVHQQAGADLHNDAPGLGPLRPGWAPGLGRGHALPALPWAPPQRPIEPVAVPLQPGTPW